MIEIARSLPASGIRKFFDLANALTEKGHEVLRMEIGRPDWQVPSSIKELVAQAMACGAYHYMPNRGDKLLREILCSQIASRTGKEYNSETEIIITTGASEAVAMCALALLAKNDEVIIPEPAWPHYKAVASLAGAKAITVNTSAKDNFIIDPEQIEKAISPHTKLLVLNTPSNPTGAIQPADVLKRLAALSEKYGFFILADEVYDHFIYGENNHVSMAKIMGDSDRLIYLNSLSKTHSITGWRIGYVCSSPVVSDALNKIHQYLTVCGVSTVHHAAARFLQTTDCANNLTEMITEFSKRRAVWTESQFPENFSFSPPSGAFYIFPKFSFKKLKSDKFCEHMLSTEHICMVPGSVFGEGFDDHVRISFSGTVETQLKARTKLINFFKNCREE